MVETDSGMLNSIGLQGPGIDAFLQRDLPWLLSRGARAMVSIAGGSVDEYAELAGRLSEAPGVTAIEVNISCPNVADRGKVFACDPDAAAAVMAAVRGRTRYDIPVFAKLSPDVTDIVTVARACVAAGSDGLSMINTLLGMAIDPDTMRPVLAGITGGLSGPAIRPVAVRCIWQVREALPDIPIIGMGGVRTGRDALEFILAGRRHGQRGHSDLQRSFCLPPHPARARGGTGHARLSGGCGTSSGSRTSQPVPCCFARHASQEAMTEGLPHEHPAAPSAHRRRA